MGKNKLFVDLSKRFFVSIISMFILIGILYITQVSKFEFVFVSVIALLSFFATYEYLKMVESKKYHLQKPIILTASIFQLLSFYSFFFFYDFFFFVFLIFFFFMIFISFKNFSKTDKALEKVSLSLFPLLYIAIPLGFIIPIVYRENGNGLYWIIYLITITKITDIGGYFGGKFFGKRKLAKNISPKKTLEGSLFGIIFACIASVLFYFFMFARIQSATTYNLSTFIMLGLILSILGQLGDLFESVLKRDCNVKDSNDIPGIGGILDMLDSLLFNIVFMYFFLGVK